MYYSLILIALIFILASIYIEREKIIDRLFGKLSIVRDREEINKMQETIKELEDKLEKTSSTISDENLKANPIYEETLDEISFEDIESEIKRDFQSTYQEAKFKSEELSIHEKVKQINKFERQGKDIDELSELMDMEKGEILLLKKLYTKSQR